MKVCFIYDDIPIYTKNKIINVALAKNNIEVIHCKSSIKNPILRNFSKFFQFLSKKNKADIILVGFVGHPLVKLVKLFTNKPVVFDVFMSMYNTLVEDKKKIKKNSIQAKILHYLDRSSCLSADLILLDTNQHINYFIKEFNIPKHKFKRLYIGALDSIFYPRDIKEEKGIFIVEFHGGFIPLQGIETIIEAARILKNEKDIVFVLAGSGQTFDKMKLLAGGLGNVSFVGALPPEIIPSFIAHSDVGLGIFGTTKKAFRVIPNKAFEVLAMGKPLITADTISERELLEDGKDVLFSKPGDPKSLADAILKLKKSNSLRKRIAKNGLIKFKSEASTKKIGEELDNYFSLLLK